MIVFFHVLSCSFTPTDSLTVSVWLSFRSPPFLFLCISLFLYQPLFHFLPLAWLCLLLFSCYIGFLITNPCVCVCVQIPKVFRSVASASTGVWSRTGRRRRASAASIRSASHRWTSSTTYLKARASAWASCARRVAAHWCTWCGPKSATASS